MIGFIPLNNLQYNFDFQNNDNTIVQTLLAIATAQQWPLFQMDVKNAFMDGDI